MITCHSMTCLLPQIVTQTQNTQSWAVRFKQPTKPQTSVAQRCLFSAPAFNILAQSMYYTQVCKCYQRLKRLLYLVFESCRHPDSVHVQSTVHRPAQYSSGALSAAANFRDYISSTKMATLLNSPSLYSSWLLLSPLPLVTSYVCRLSSHHRPSVSFYLSNLHLCFWTCA